MKTNLTPLEETDIIGNFQTPHLQTANINMNSEKRVSRNILSRKEDEILLVNSNAFSRISVIAGLSEKHIEYIAKNAPQDYKTNIFKILRDSDMMNGVFEIARSMDQDAGNSDSRNEDRINNVIRYVNDNQIAFEF
jgi:hypothetical protein